METLDGILIATTNLCDNFDSAFERRFLFKVKFGQPTTDAKKSIWKSKLPWLPEEDCAKLAARYDLSGGEIDNIVRKSYMEEVLSGNRPTVEMLEAWCKGEKLTRKGGNTIGFAC
jgi:SpoVK/Ycf46/Vps4 family AAA+-type ATPase